VAALYKSSAALNLNIMFGHAHEAMAASDVVLAASGTATLEAALLKRPMVITYRVPRLSAWIMRKQGDTPYVGLPNILAGELIVPELLQDEATPDRLSAALLELLRDKNARARLEGQFDTMLNSLRQNTASRLAEAVLPLIGSRVA
jgi:lipid-A-disaccharide synthase